MTSFIPRYHDAETHDAQPQDAHQRATPGNRKLPLSLSSISSNLAFRLAVHIFTKTRFSSHINFISRCLQNKGIPKGFRSNFHASIFSNVSNLKKSEKSVLTERPQLRSHVQENRRIHYQTRCRKISSPRSA